MEATPKFLRVLDSLGLGSADSLGVPLLIVLIFFVLNLSLSSLKMVRRIKAKQKAAGSFKAAEAINALPNFATFQAPAGSSRKISSYFKKRGFRLGEESSDAVTRLYAVKHGAGHWGVFFFHLTFMVLLVGALLSMLTRFEGYAEVSPGDVFVEKRDSYKAASGRPLLFGNDRLFKLRLDASDLSYWQPGVVKQRASIMSMFDADGAFLGRKRMEINHPLHIDGMNIYQGTRQGFLAQLEASNSSGDKITGNAVFRIPEKAGDRMMDTVNIGGSGLNLDLELFTEKIGEIKGLESMRSTHMATLLKVTSVQGGRRVFRGALFLGGAIFFDGIIFRFVGLKSYSSFVVVRDYGVPVIFASFVPLLAGLLITYFWVPESYWAIIKRGDGGCSVMVGATAERFKESFRERFDAQVNELRSDMEPE